MLVLGTYLCTVLELSMVLKDVSMKADTLNTDSLSTVSMKVDTLNANSLDVVSKKAVSLEQGPTCPAGSSHQP